MEDVYYVSSSLAFFFSKTNIIKYLKTKANCKNSITIINEISLSLSLSLSLSMYVYIYIYIKDKKKIYFLKI